MNPKPRARDLPLPLPGTPGTHNAITDVPGVHVGFTTLISEYEPLEVGTGPVRTGVTAVLPRGKRAEYRPVWGAYHSFNGNGELTGTHWLEDAGHFYGPVILTNTHSVGVAHHAAVKWMTRQYADVFQRGHAWAMPVVAETYDGVLNDINGQHVMESHVLAAIDAATGGHVAEGNVGGGTGMISYGFKGGTGTSSRVVRVGDAAYRVGVLVQANFGVRPWLTVLGVPVGQEMPLHTPPEPERGSVIVIIATDAPLLPGQLKRVAKRATLGIGRTGTVGGNSSGDLFLAFSVANDTELQSARPALHELRFIPDAFLDVVYEATCQAVEESVLNALLAAEAMTAVKPAGLLIPALPHEALVDVMRRYGRVTEAP